MSDALYFQWQNDVLRKSIYPLREMKLRDFLVHFREIELWKEYEGKDFSGEVDDYLEKKKQAVKKVVQEYYNHQTYFKDLDNVQVTYAEYVEKTDMMASEALDAIYKFHKVFNENLGKIENKPRHETYFLSQRVLYWLGYRKEYLKKIASKQRRVDGMKLEKPNSNDLKILENDLASMKDRALKMIDLELERLYAYTAALGKIEKRKLDLMTKVNEAGKKKSVAEQELGRLRQKIEAQMELQIKTQDGLARLKSPPNLDSVQSYFSAPDLSAQIKGMFEQASDALIEMLGGFRKEMVHLLRTDKPVTSKLKGIKNVIDELLIYRKDIQKEILKLDTNLKNMGDKWARKTEREAERDNLRDVSLKVVDQELNRLADYYIAFEYSIRKDEWAGLIEAQEKELVSVGQTISKLKDDAGYLQEQIDKCEEVLDIHEDKRLGEYIPELNKDVTREDIVQAKADEYKASLMGQDHYELLKLVVAEFKSKPWRYPKWLQYMVIHFSGMRYASAHGSWADPKDLLANLRASQIEAEMKDDKDGNLETECRKKLDFYEPTEDTPLFTDEQKPKLALVTEGEWKEKVDEHIKDIKRALEMKSTYHQLQALINLTIDEESYEIDQMASAEVYEDLLTFKAELPEWMWREIVRLTELRVTEVKDENWEKQQGLSGGYTKKDLQFRTMLEDWKKKYLTSWREEHGDSERLVVSRAVCNEVAEHIQHLRGLKPGGGLTAKPTWYQSTEKNDPNAYLVKPITEEDFKPGASILWLRFVRKKPNEWQQANPIMTVRGKYELLPPGYKGQGKSFANGTTSWSYDLGSNPIRRWRKVAAVDGVVEQQEWLRWMHEATVVETAKTADGDVVLTFETALPGDDPRLSTIGVFKRRLSDLTDDGTEDAYHRSFVGYIPEGEVPGKNLDEMLDWEKILARPVQQATDDHLA